MMRRHAPQMFYIWYGDKWDLSFKDYSSTPKILTGAPQLAFAAASQPHASPWPVRVQMRCQQAAHAGSAFFFGHSTW